ncbi:hypothetical protein ACTXMZ_15630 [Brachybacterium alimentarium]|uniref:hypothetical protein n=1 Tax=Brachybacterium alimentarium TaxID=47845 RepID=UPI003FD402BA
MSNVTDATRAFRHHRVEWFPPEPPHSRVPALLCLGCGWRTELNGFADESSSGLEHRMEAALAEVGLTKKEARS